MSAGTINIGPAQNMYVVPTGNSFILKSIILSPTASGQMSYSVGLFAVPENVAVTLLEGTVAQNNAFVWEGWTVLNAGDALFLAVTLENANYWVAGALLPYAS